MVGANADDEFGLSTYLKRFVNDTRLYEYLSKQDVEQSANNFDEMILLDKFRTPFSGFNTKIGRPSYVNYAGPGLRPNLWYSQIREVLTKPSHPENILVKDLKTDTRWHEKPNRMVDQLTPFLSTEIYSSLFDEAYGCTSANGELPRAPDVVFVSGSLGTNPGIVHSIVKDSIRVRQMLRPELKVSFVQSQAAAWVNCMQKTFTKQTDGSLQAALFELAHAKPTADTVLPDITLRRELYPRRTHPGLIGS